MDLVSFVGGSVMGKTPIVQEVVHPVEELIFFQIGHLSAT